MASTVVNKVPYDFYSLETEISSAEGSFGIVEGLEELDYTVKIARTKLRGTSRKPVMRTSGDMEPDGHITVLRSWFDSIAAKAKELGIALADLSMTLAISYQHKGEVLHTDTLTEVALAEIGNSHKRGPDGLIVTLPLDIMNVYFDGVDVFGDKL